MWTSFLMLTCAALLGGFWYEALRAREHANRIAIETCERLQVQFLDGTVAFSSLRPARDAAGRFGWRRSYVFDYTDDGQQRRQGFVILHGNALETVGLAPGNRSVN